MNIEEPTTLEMRALLAAGKALGVGIIAFQEDEHGQVRVAHSAESSGRAGDLVKGCLAWLSMMRKRAIEKAGGES